MEEKYLLDNKFSPLIIKKIWNSLFEAKLKIILPTLPLLWEKALAENSPHLFIRSNKFSLLIKMELINPPSADLFRPIF
jgi:hypothetical protein